MKYGATYLLWIAALAVILNSSGCKKEDGDTTDPLRTAALDLYEAEYLPSEVADPQWTGSVAICNPGTIPQSVQDKVQQRVNYFRKAEGLPPVTFLAARNAIAQEAALVLFANDTLTHNPPNTFSCWTQNAADGCHDSNISSNHSSGAITQFMDDWGDNNISVTHRFWILLPQMVHMGHGCTDHSDALLVWDDYYEPLPDSVPEFIVWPPQGYVPAPLVFDRWSFEVTRAVNSAFPDYTNATVTVTDDDGAAMSLNIIYEDLRLVWEPQNIQTTSTEDVIYHVSIGQVTIDGVVKSYTYDVKIFQP